MINLDTIVARNAAIHPWRPESFVRELAQIMAAEGVPFCAECADWHHPHEEHSATDVEQSQ